MEIPYVWRIAASNQIETLYSGRHLVQEGHIVHYLALVLSSSIAKVYCLTKMEEYV